MARREHLRRLVAWLCLGVALAAGLLLWGEQVPRALSDGSYLAEDFDGYAPGSDPTDWIDQDSTLAMDDSFKTITWDGARVLGTSLTGDSRYAHYNAAGATTWENYEFSGRFYFSHKQGGVGITFYSRYLDGQDRYYRLLHYPGQSGFRIMPHGTDISDGTTTIEIDPQVDTWYRFRIRVETHPSRITIQARVWQEGQTEPDAWLIDCYDSYTYRIKSGTVGVWTLGSGFKAVDDLQVVSLDAAPGTMPTPVASPSPPPRPTSSFWPISLYDVPRGDFGVIQGTGFSHVHQFNSTQTITQAIQYLDSAHEASLQIVQNMPSSDLYASDEFWIEWVESLADYDALAWWYLPEEPTDYGALNRLHKIVRRHDSHNRPAVTYFATMALEDWCDAVDVMFVGSFPEYYEEPRSNVRARVELVSEACPGIPVVAVPMLFDANWDGTGDYPTPQEARCDAYTAIIAGADGLQWYSYARGVGLTDLWDGVQAVAAELSSLLPVLAPSDTLLTPAVEILSGPTQSPESEGRIYSSIQVLGKVYQNDLYVFATNLATDTVTVRFEGLPSSVDLVDVLFEERTLSVSDGFFQDSFDAYQVHVYTVTDVLPPDLIYLPLVLKGGER